MWSKFSKEIISSHGYEKNEISVWKYNPHKEGIEKQADLYGHLRRVLHMAMSPDGQFIASAAADETLRFWKVFE